MGGSRNRARAVVKIVLAPSRWEAMPWGESHDLHILFSAYTPKALHLTRCAAALHIRKNLLQSYEIILRYANIYALFLKFFFNIFGARFRVIWSTPPCVGADPRVCPNNNEQPACQHTIIHGQTRGSAPTEYCSLPYGARLLTKRSMPL